MKNKLSLIILFVVSVSVWASEGQRGGSSAAVTDKAISEHAVRSLPVRIDGQAYWYYEALGRLRNLTSDGTTTRGTFLERARLIPFWVPNKAIQDSPSRGVGYVKSIATILATLDPKNVRDTPENRAYQKTLRARLESITGQRFDSDIEWNKWFETNRSNLVWSDQRKQLVIQKRSKSR